MSLTALYDAWENATYEQSPDVVFEYMTDDDILVNIEQYYTPKECFITLIDANTSFIVGQYFDMNIGLAKAIQHTARNYLPKARAKLNPPKPLPVSPISECAWCGREENIYRFLPNGQPICFDCQRAFDLDE